MVIEALTEELNALVEKYPRVIPLRSAAKYMGISDESLRSSIDQGKCPFGISWESENKRGYKVSTLPFYAYMTGRRL